MAVDKKKDMSGGVDGQARLSDIRTATRADGVLALPLASAPINGRALERSGRRPSRGLGCYQNHLTGQIRGEQLRVDCVIQYYIQTSTYLYEV